MRYLQQLIEQYPLLKTNKDAILKAFGLIVESFNHNGKLLIVGNGGSAADAEHIAGELMKSFVKKRPLPSEIPDSITQIDPEAGGYLVRNLQGGLPAISLSNHTALISACINDIDGNIIYTQQVYALGTNGDVFLGISTSGNSKNIHYAMITAKAKNMKTIALTGNTGGVIATIADVAIIVPEVETYKIQELHLPVYHTLCLMIEDYFYP
jgi:D-sedoheptulose 7-phosphate isomerase